MAAEMTLPYWVNGGMWLRQWKAFKDENPYWVYKEKKWYHFVRAQAKRQLHITGLIKKYLHMYMIYLIKS